MSDYQDWDDWYASGKRQHTPTIVTVSGEGGFIIPMCLPTPVKRNRFLSNIIDLKNIHIST